MLYRDWLNLNLHLLWCHDQPVSKGKHPDAPTTFSEYSNSGAWLIRKGWARVEHDGVCYHAGPGQSGQCVVEKAGLIPFPFSNRQVESSLGELE